MARIETPSHPRTELDRLVEGGLPICEKCGREPGQPYPFLFGTNESFARGNKWVTRRQLKGEGVASVCDRCIAADRRRKTLWLAIATFPYALAVAISAIAALVGGLDDAAVPLLISGAMALVLGGALVYQRMMSPEERGQKIAIRLHRGELRRQGYNEFWTPKQWEAM